MTGLGAVVTLVPNLPSTLGIDSRTCQEVPSDPTVIRLKPTNATVCAVAERPKRIRAAPRTNTRKIHWVPVAHKTLTISEDAYRALYKLKRDRESFTDVVLRLAKQKEIGSLSDYLETAGPDDELARNIEETSKRLRSLRRRRVKL